MPDRKALCLASGELAEIGTADRQVLSGDPLDALHAVPRQYVDSRLNLLAVGEELFPRGLLSVGYSALGNQTLRLGFFTARKTETTTQVRLISGSTAAGPTPTLARVGLYLIADSGDGTLVASTVNDTSLFATAATIYTRSWAAPYAKVAGQRYALGVLFVTTAAVPTIGGTAVLNAAELAVAPRITGSIGSQTDLPSSFAAATPVASISHFYGAAV